MLSQALSVLPWVIWGAAILCGFFIPYPVLYLVYSGVSAVFVLLSIVRADWLAVTSNTAMTLWFYWMWRRRGPRRKRALREFGEKSRARLAAVVRKARERLVPRRVLRPVPA